MTELEKLMALKEDLVKKLVSMKNMRRGSVVAQFYDIVKADGSTKRNGPYYLYLSRDNIKKKSLSRRLKDEEEAQRYRYEISNFRSFEELCAKYVDVWQKICDINAQGGRESKEKSQSESKKELLKGALKGSKGEALKESQEKKSSKRSSRKSMKK